MTARDLRYQLLRLDRAIFELLDERARLIAELDADAAPAEARALALDDILARHGGDLTADQIRRVAAAIDAAFGAPSGETAS